MSEATDTERVITWKSLVILLGRSAAPVSPRKERIKAGSTLLGDIHITCWLILHIYGNAKDHWYDITM